MTKRRDAIRRTIKHCRKANAEMARIHPELATPKLLSEIQGVAKKANESHIKTLKTLAKLDKHLSLQGRRIKRLERLARRCSDGRDSP